MGAKLRDVLNGGKTGGGGGGGGEAEAGSMLAEKLSYIDIEKNNLLSFKITQKDRMFSRSMRTEH